MHCDGWCRDTEVLCESLTYDQGPPEVLRGISTGQYTRVYRPPFDEFEVSRMELPGAADTIVPANQVTPIPTSFHVETRQLCVCITRDARGRVREVTHAQHIFGMNMQLVQCYHHEVFMTAPYPLVCLF